jgi:asparagine synthase (glutamine-hydrolysing)
MCGITGFMDLKNGQKVEREVLERMTNRLAHRGPDSTGFFIDKGLGLGFRRLSIMDLEGGDQPIYNEDRSIVLLCNGEIYNYKELRSDLEQKGHLFRSKSDVEVLVHLYEELGVGLLEKLNGQFAFVIYDKRNNVLFLARDHFGINPLYYTLVNDLFIFGSEIKAILEHPLVRREVNLTGLDQILSFPGLISPQTMFKDIYSLKSGHYILIKNSDIRIAEYWDLDYPQIGDGAQEKPESYYVERLSDLLAQSVKYRLQADVSVGLYLSGGLDSSLIAAMARRASESEIHSFSVAFEDKEICESKYQAVMVDHIGSVHHEITFDWAEIAIRLEEMVYHCECPVKETFNTCSLALSDAARKAGLKVILAGEGADEIFAGYIGYRFDQFGLRSNKQADLDTLLEDEVRERLWGDKDIFYETDLYSLNEIKTALYSPELSRSFNEFDCLNFPPVNKGKLKGRHPLHQRSYLDFKLRLSDHLISEHGDRMILANSVEGRYPFLDIDLIEFAKEVPPDLKLNQFVEKYILKKVAAPLLPDEIINREKFGFRSPGSPYLLRQKIDWIDDLLSYDRIKRQGYFNPDMVERLKTQYSQEGFKIHPHLEIDLLMVVLASTMLLDLFRLPNLN